MWGYVGGRVAVYDLRTGHRLRRAAVIRESVLGSVMVREHASLAVLADEQHRYCRYVVAVLGALGQDVSGAVNRIRARLRARGIEAHRANSVSHAGSLSRIGAIAAEACNARIAGAISRPGSPYTLGTRVAVHRRRLAVWALFLSRLRCVAGSASAVHRLRTQDSLRARVITRGGAGAGRALHTTIIRFRIVLREHS